MSLERVSAVVETAKSRYRPILYLAVVFLLALLATAAYKSGRDLAATRRYEDQLLDRIADTRLRIRELQHRISLLDDDPLTLERLAREDLGMVRPGDVVIILPEEPDG